MEDRAASKRSYDRDDYYVTKGTARSPRGAGSKDPAPPKTEDEDAHARTYIGGGGWMGVGGGCGLRGCGAGVDRGGMTVSVWG